MDASERYIKMCERAEEIQSLRRGTAGWADWPIGDVIWSPKQAAVLIILPFDGNDNLAWDIERECIVIRDHHECLSGIWLPRQGQLQEILVKDLGIAYQISFMLLDDFFDWLKALSYNEKCEIYSYEQLWLLFLMKWKYCKVWNGNNWEAVA